MSLQTVRQTKTDTASYAALKARVRETLLLGQRQIEEAKVRTYWNTGKLINEHLLQNKARAEYGKQLLERLAKDLGIHVTVLRRTTQFHQAIPIRAARRELTWTHYRELMTISDEKTRLSLLDRAADSRWSTARLIEKIKLEARPGTSKGNGKGEKPAAEIPKLVPKLGTLYVYRVIRHESLLSRKPELKLDLGFNNKNAVSRLTKGLKEGQIVESLRDEAGEYSVKPSKLTEAALFTYKADVERVVDGDTLVVNIDQGFGMEARHYLRLRGVNCKELGEDAGKKAKAFVEKLLDGVDYVILRSSRSDMYGRYLADVHMPLKDGKMVYLNQRLIDEGLAVRVRE